MQALLLYQKCDSERRNIQAILEGIPEEIKCIDKKISTIKESFAHERKSMLEGESRRKTAEHELQAVEEKIVQLKTQQMAIRSQEAYNVASQTIENLAEESRRREDVAVQLLLEVDRMREALAQNEQQGTKRIEEQNKLRTRVGERVEELKIALKQAEQEAQLAEVKVEKTWLEAYHLAATHVKRSPFVVELKDQICAGCHLKVSHETLQNASRGNQPTLCEHCGRLLMHVDS